MARETSAQLKCAVYTRKSSENGLEKVFNSLDAQRESAEAYIKSQQHEGWVLIKAPYDDGGFSGGNTSRPALKKLLDDIEAGLINVVVVYKVDRLTRSLPDFAKLVELFDKHGVSFVSVTQQFNTTTSMGRLTLNVLLSFAQFEREVAGERIRDKFEASRKKGMWMGGQPPIGYDIDDRKLVVNASEAKTVRHIFARYLALGSVQALKEDLEKDGYRSKKWTSSSNRDYGDIPFKRGALYYILKNRLYIGDVVHKGLVYPGEHEGIIDQAIWNRVQATLEEKAAHHEKGTSQGQPSLLRGLLFDDRGNHMSPSHANKKGKRYRYYISQALSQHRAKDAGSITRIPAHDIEALVAEQIRSVATEIETLSKGLDSADRERLRDAAAQLNEAWPKLDWARRCELVRAMARSVTIAKTAVKIIVSRPTVLEVLQKQLWKCDEKEILKIEAEDSKESDLLEVVVPVTIQKIGSEKVIEAPGMSMGDHARSPNAALIGAVVKAHDWFTKLKSDEMSSVNHLSSQLNLSRKYVARILRLAFLAPDIVEAILEGAQPRALTLDDLIKPMPMDWDDQRRMFGLIPV